MLRGPPRPTRTAPPVPYTALFRSVHRGRDRRLAQPGRAGRHMAADHARQGVLLSRPLGRSGGGVEAAGDPDCRSDARFGGHPRQLLGLRPPRAEPVLPERQVAVVGTLSSYVWIWVVAEVFKKKKK